MNIHNRITAVKAFAVLFLFLIGACSKDEISPKMETMQDIVSDEVKAQFVKLGFDVSDIKLIKDGYPLSKGSSKKNYLVEGDIVITPENLKAMLSSIIDSTGVHTEQYRTFNKVSSYWPFYRTIRVLGITSGNYVLDAKMQTALTNAVNNYKALYGSDFTIKFTLTFGPSSAVAGNYDIIAYNIPDPGKAGGQSGFPSSGNPHKIIFIFSGTSQYSTDVVEHVFTHEIGHCLGLRHSDYMNRSLSCGGTAINEGSANVGAVHVPGTPLGYDPSSVMKSCFNGSETGEFGEYDIVALKNLY